MTLDLDPAFGADIQVDMSEFARDIDRYLHGWRPDVILASPPCEAFSVMTIGRNWTMDHRPKTEKAEKSLQLVGDTVYAIHWLRPRFFIIENPRAKLRRLPPVQHLDRVTVTYCQYGEPFMKPTDLWGGFPPSWWPRPPCKNGDPCHRSAARGSRTGIQGGSVAESNPEIAAAFERMAAKPTTSRTKFKGGMIEVMSRFPSWSQERKTLSALRAKIPAELSLSICQAAEKDMT